MATYDLTSGSTAGVGANSVATLPSKATTHPMRKIEARLDMAKMIADGYSVANGDIFQLLEIPAESFVLAAGAEVETAFDGTTPTVDIDFAAGDDIVDDGDVTSAGYLAGGTNGMGIVVGGTPTFTQHVTTTDTIDVVLTAASADVTEGVLRVFAVVLDTSAFSDATVADRDQLA